MSEPVIALVGHPNCGKTTLFNHLTQSHYQTVNYPGATVDYAQGHLQFNNGQRATVIDTPGIVSLIPRSEDERVTLSTLIKLNYLIEGHPSGNPDLIVVVVDLTQPARHLALAYQLKQAGFPLIVALSMLDLTETEAHCIHPDQLATQLTTALGCPVLAFSGRTRHGVGELRATMESQLKKPSISGISVPASFSTEDIVAQFNWVETIVSTCTPNHKPVRKFDPDQVFLHPILGFVLFAGLMTLFFWSIFTLAAPAMDGIDAGFSWLIQTLNQAFGPHIAILTNGVLAGIGSVLVFTPQLLLLFMVMGILENSGYLARGAVLMDKPLSYLGLNGRSFVPLLSGYACAIPAMMAARTIPGKKARLLTLFVIPLMSCSARLPVYGLLLSLLFIGKNPFWGGLAMTGIYLGSVVLASVVAAMAGRLMQLPKSDAGFQLELPRWRKPVFKHILPHAWNQTLSFVRRAGPTIMGVSLVLWALTHYPSEQASYAATLGHWIEPLLRPMGLDWRVGVALLLSFAAREVFVSALILAFSLSTDSSLLSTLAHATQAGTGQPLFTPASITALIVFFMISMQCASTVAVAKKEMGGWKYPAIMTVSYIGMAYLLACLCHLVLS
ncbi:MAG: ferrous iron transporter B [Candidatus Margulisiibacteriota bacterium]